MYREEFTRRWTEDQFPEREGGSQYRGNETSNWRDKFNQATPYSNTNPYGNNVGVPLPIRHESELRRPVIRRNHEIPGRSAETNFGGNNYTDIPSRDERGVDNFGFSTDGRRNRLSYDGGSFIAPSRSEPMHFYNGRTPSEPGRRPPGWEVSRNSELSYPTQSRYTNINTPSSKSNVPLWMKPFESEGEENDNKSLDITSKVNQTSMGAFVSIRIIIICLIIWDLVNDWLLAVSGPIQFLGITSEKNCIANNKTLVKTLMLNVSKVDTSMCNKSNDIWTLAAVFTLLGSLLAILQVINIVMEIIKRRNPRFFQILQGHSEICFVMFFEELPQCLLFAIYLCVCDCSSFSGNLNLYSLLSSISACAAMTLRFVSSFESISGDTGCCNVWWRCCCCKNQDYICRLQGKECCCTCDMPCPLCCCTLQCNMCRYTPHSWCSSMLKAFSCFCGCCKTEDDSYGIRIMNNLSLFILWACMAFQILIFYSMVR